MKYRETLPRPPLSQFIECFWTLESKAGAESVQPQRILPDGCAELVFNFGAPFLEHSESGRRTRQPLHFLVGQLTKPLLISPTGAVQVLGIRFHPGGTLPFFRLPMNELTDRVTALETLGGQWEWELLARLSDAPSLSQRVSTAENLLNDRLRDSPRRSGLVELTAEVVRCAGMMPIDRLAARAGFSRRQLERRFLREVGVGPKHLCRILRFQEVFRAVERNDARWAVIATDCGYYDQAHLIREFQEFAQQTPTALLMQLDGLTESFTRKSRMSHFSNPGF